LQVDVAGSDEGVDARPLGFFESLGGGGNVLGVGAGQAGDDRAADFGGDFAYGGEVSLRGGGEPGLDDVDAELGEGLGDLQFFRGVEGDTGGLFAVPKRRVEYPDVPCFHSGSPPFCRKNETAPTDAMTSIGAEYSAVPPYTVLFHRPSAAAG